MSYTSNQYNYCTPLSSVAALTDASKHVVDKKYFSLHDNILDGSFFPVTDDVGIWGVSVADSDGALAVPLIVTIEQDMRIEGLQILSSQHSYITALTVDIYSGDALLHGITETGISDRLHAIMLPEIVDATKVILTITHVSEPGSVAKLYQVLQALDVRILTGDNLTITTPSSSSILNTIDKTTDDIKIQATPAVSHVNVHAAASDKVAVTQTEASTLLNVHSAMRSFSRHILGKVYVTYTDPMLVDTNPVIVPNDMAYNSKPEQILDGVRSSENSLFTLYDNDLSGNYHPSSEYSQVGWTSKAVSDADGYFAEPQKFSINFLNRPLVDFAVHFDDSRGIYAEYVTVDITDSDGTVHSYTFEDNTSASVEIPDTFSDAVAVTVTVRKLSKGHCPVTILDVPVLSTFLYTGYDDDSQLISITTLEELSYDDDVEALGGMSANEVKVVFDNSSRYFNIDNDMSPVAAHMRRNRKVVPWLGVEIAPGFIEWYKQGVYWTYKWDVPYDSLIASLTAFDTIGLLDTTSFTEHYVFVNRSIGYLIDYVLNDAKSMLDFVDWYVAEELYDVVIPYAWFEAGSHSAALRRICKAYPMHIYCDKDGRINAMPQRIHLDYAHDVWSDSTNVINKEYSSLYTVLPNVLNIVVNNIVLGNNEQLVWYNTPFDVAETPTKTLNFSNPYISDLRVDIDADSTVVYTYRVYSWGITFDFSGAGMVRSIVCNGAALDTSNTITITKQNTESVRRNGVVTRDISAEFIQTTSLASFIADRIFALSENDIYDAEVTYRGNIALTVNSSVTLLDGTSPINKYTIKRHQLVWDGGLSGTANLNT